MNNLTKPEQMQSFDDPDKIFQDNFPNILPPSCQLWKNNSILEIIFIVMK